MDLDWLRTAPVRRFTRQEFRALAERGILREDERVELIRGVLVEMSPISAEHEWSIEELFKKLYDSLRGRAQVRMNTAFALAEDSQPQPDILVFPAGDYRHELPSKSLFVVEVALTSLKYDRDVKARLYAEEGVPEYWLVDVTNEKVHLCDRPRKGAYRRHRTLGKEGILSPGKFPDVEIPVREILP